MILFINCALEGTGFTEFMTRSNDQIGQKLSREKTFTSPLIKWLKKLVNIPTYLNIQILNIPI